ncbi:hypothetical protein Q9L58_008797 [Maublancomyces gigas]|uniref:Uncharacterized protein n=1 Tax=Discina gigas TaxID=1032678 RepID=A0ABR3G8Q1_9PEZI
MRLQSLSARCPEALKPTLPRKWSIFGDERSVKAKPTTPKLNIKFSTTNNCTIYYDGEAQTTLYQCWGIVNKAQGMLAKEVRISKTRKFSAAAAALCDDEEPKEDERMATEEERQKGELEAQAKETLEFFNSCFKEVAKCCEDTAFRWLKGEDCSMYVSLMVGKVGEMVGQIAKLPKPSQLEEMDVGHITMK